MLVSDLGPLVIDWYPVISAKCVWGIVETSDGYLLQDPRVDIVEAGCFGCFQAFKELAHALIGDHDYFTFVMFVVVIFCESFLMRRKQGVPGCMTS